MKLSIATLLLIGTLSPTPDQDRRIRKLEDSLMAPCCYSQTIRDHMSMEAAQMRDEVSNMVISGKSDKEILNYYVREYGQTILVVPDGVTGVIAIAVPIGGILLAVGILGIYMARSVHRRSATTSSMPSTSSASIPAEVLNRIRSELGDEI